MSETITITGNIGSDISNNTTINGDAVTNFRLASTERRFDRATNEWIDGDTNWYSVVCFRNLARNAGCSLTKGQPVIVTGKLKLRPWEKEGKSGLNVQIEAEAIGHNLRLGSTRFSGGGGERSNGLHSNDEAPATGSLPTAGGAYDDTAADDAESPYEEGDAGAAPSSEKQGAAF